MNWISACRPGAPQAHARQGKGDFLGPRRNERIAKRRPTREVDSYRPAQQPRETQEDDVKASEKASKGRQPKYVIYELFVAGDSDAQYASGPSKIVVVPGASGEHAALMLSAELARTMKQAIEWHRRVGHIHRRLSEIEQECIALNSQCRAMADAVIKTKQMNQTHNSGERVAQGSEAMWKMMEKAWKIMREREDEERYLKDEVLDVSQRWFGCQKLLAEQLDTVLTRCGLMKPLGAPSIAADPSDETRTSSSDQFVKDTQHLAGVDWDYINDWTERVPHESAQSAELLPKDFSPTTPKLIDNHNGWATASEEEEHWDSVSVVK
ncbi:hypothetical protein LTS18_007035 [Coniosporium uncinatum]|uniref:Uncharacterized protein n=1 Tax=Coniosporium uncinatum TaxID=93489 RepID=A0ACC3DQ10_9PEZI|nr:hypothetical protein LTS18_007035 [Coniosporium uncinatum]